MLVKFGVSTRKAVEASANLGRWVAAIVLGMMMLLTAADVVGRYFFNRSIVAAHDVTELMMVAVIFLGLAYTATIKGHIRVEVVISKLSKHTQSILDTITSIFSAGVFGAIAWRLGVHSWSSFTRGEGTPTVGITIAPFLCLAAIGAAMLCAQLLVEFCDSMRRAIAKTAVK